MSIDSHLRDELRHAVDGLDPREEIALQQVKAAQPVAWADFTVVALEDAPTSRSRPTRAQRVVGALAACALIAGAVALPLALRNRQGKSAPVAAGRPVTTGYQSTVTVRIGPAPSPRSAQSVTTTQPVSVKLGDPVQLALRPGLREKALQQAQLRANDPAIDFSATTDAAGDVLSLTVVAPTATDATALARDWATIFGTARRADAKAQIRERTHRLDLQVTRLHSELQRVDKQLVQLAPGTYKDLLQYDSPHADVGHPRPPPVPERATPKVLDLAFERIQILATLSQAGRNAATTRIAEATPEVFAQLISQTPAVLIKPPHHNSSTSSTWIAIALLLGGVVLATSAFLLGRRSRGLSFRSGSG